MDDDTIGIDQCNPGGARELNNRKGSGLMTNGDGHIHFVVAER